MHNRTIQWTYLLSLLNVDLTANDLLPTYLLWFADSNGSFTALEAFCEYSFSCARACKNMSHGSRAPLYLPLATCSVVWRKTCPYSEVYTGSCCDAKFVRNAAYAYLIMPPRYIG